MLAVGLLGTVVDVLVVVDAVEHSRRLAAQCGALDDLQLLDLLCDLPRWEPVPLRALTAAERRRLGDVPPGVVTIADHAVVRAAGPPVAGVLAVVTASAWDRGLNRASRFAPVATRVLVLPRPTPHVAHVAAEAAHYGIGLVIPAGSSLRVAVQPQLWRERRFSPGGWLFREQVYAALRRSLSTHDSDTPR